jgi:hypothetical protein
LIAFGPAAESNPLVTDAEFLSLVDWDSAASKTLRQSAQCGDWQRTVRLLMSQAAGSRPPSTARVECDVKLALWSVHHLECPKEASRLVAAWEAFRPDHTRRTAWLGTNGQGPKVDPIRNGMVASWRELAAATDEWLSSAFATRQILRLEMLVLFEIVREAGSLFQVDLASRLWRASLESAIRQLSKNGPVAGQNSAPLDSGTHVARAAIDAELAWQAGLLFAPVAGSAALRDAGRAALWRLVAESSDSSGVPAARALGDLPVWVTSVLRAREWGRGFGRPLFNASQEKRLRAIVSSVAKFCRQDGRPSLSRGETNGLARVWPTAATVFPSHLRQASDAVQYLLSIGEPKVNGARTRAISRNGSRRNGAFRPKSSRPVFQSDESRLACLRSNWTSTANSILVSHPGRTPTLEMATHGATLISGDWELDVRIDGRPVDLPGWECVCWRSDEDGDYLELQSRAPGVRVERQVYLSRTDDFALLAHMVACDGNCSIQSVSRLVLSPDCAAYAQTRTRELRLACRGGSARVFPLALNCSRVEGVTGGLSASDGRLQLNEQGVRGLYSPLAFDWSPRRRRSRADWRRLTVATAGVAVPGGEAAGFLLENGASKWLIYRSLAPALEPRSVLGQHTMYETLLGQFVQGDVESFVQVERPVERSE